jgi:hypothetical protein
VLERYKQYLLRPDLILVLMVAAAGFGIYFLGQQIGGLPEEEDDLERQIQRRATNLDDLAQRAADLESQVTELEAQEIPQPFLSLAEATNLGPALSAYVSDNDLKLLNFNTSRQYFPISEEEQRPVVSYLIVAQGDATALVGLLDLVDAVDTAVVQTLEFSREPELQVDWILNLSMIVHHSLQ